MEKIRLATVIGVEACNRDKCDLLICNEWGYVPFEKDGAQLLFHVISECYEKRSIIITTNLEFSK